MDVYFDILPIFDYSVIDRKNLKKIYFGVRYPSLDGITFTSCVSFLNGVINKFALCIELDKVFVALVVW